MRAIIKDTLFACLNIAQDCIFQISYELAIKTFRPEKLILHFKTLPLFPQHQCLYLLSSFQNELNSVKISLL